MSARQTNIKTSRRISKLERDRDVSLGFPVNPQAWQTYKNTETNIEYIWNPYTYTWEGNIGTDIAVGTAEGQLTYWDDSGKLWTPSNATHLKWDTGTNTLTATNIITSGTITTGFTLG